MVLRGTVEIVVMKVLAHFKFRVRFWSHSLLVPLQVWRRREKVYKYMHILKCVRQSIVGTTDCHNMSHRLFITDRISERKYRIGKGFDLSNYRRTSCFMLPTQISAQTSCNTVAKVEFNLMLDEGAIHPSSGSHRGGGGGRMGTEASPSTSQRFNFIHFLFF